MCSRKNYVEMIIGNYHTIFQFSAQEGTRKQLYTVPPKTHLFHQKILSLQFWCFGGMFGCSLLALFIGPYCFLETNFLVVMVWCTVVLFIFSSDPCMDNKQWRVLCTFCDSYAQNQKRVVHACYITGRNSFLPPNY